MAAFDTLSVTLDTAESRIQRERLVALVDGKHWDILASTAVVEGITRTGMLTPLYFTPEWQTTTTGAYARLKKSDYTFYQYSPTFPGAAGHPEKWVEHHSPIQGNIYLHGLGVNEVAATNQSWDRNRGFLLGWFSYNSGQNSQVQIEFNWQGDDGTGIALRFWSDGKCEIWKNLIQVGEGNIFERHVTTQTVFGKERLSENLRPKASKGDAKQLAQQVVEVLIIPYKRRELLLLSNQGGGFRFTFTDIDENDPSPTITPAGKVSWYVPPPGQPTALLAPVRYLTTGNLISQARSLRLAPQVTEEPEFNVYWDAPGYGTGGVSPSLLNASGAAPFVPDGSQSSCRVQVALSSDGESTPFVYGASAVFPAIVALTDASESSSLEDFAIKFHLSVPESPADVQAEITVRSPEEVEIATAGLRITENRAAECSIGGVAILTGRTLTPHWTESVSDAAREAVVKIKDRCQAAEDYRFLDALPFDGLELSDAFVNLATLPGYSDADCNAEYFGFPLPTVGHQSEAEFVLLPQVGDKSLDWIRKLWETFARHTLWGWVPTASGPEFQVTSLDTLDALVPQLAVYPNAQEAMTAGIDPAQAYRYVYRAYKEDIIRCEANDIWVTGRDPKTGKPIQAHYADTASQDPTLPPSARPTNWVGEPRRYGWVDPAITNQEVANWVCATLARRLTPARKLVEWECDFLLRPDGAPLWRTQKLTLSGVGDARVMTLDGEISLDNSAEVWRPFKYTGEIPL